MILQIIFENKLVKWSKIVIPQPKPLEKPNIIELNSVSLEHLQASH